MVLLTTVGKHRVLFRTVCRIFFLRFDGLRDKSFQAVSKNFSELFRVQL